MPIISLLCYTAKPNMFHNSQFSPTAKYLSPHTCSWSSTKSHSSHIGLYSLIAKLSFTHNISLPHSKILPLHIGSLSITTQSHCPHSCSLSTTICLWSPHSDLLLPTTKSCFFHTLSLSYSKILLPYISSFSHS